MIARFDAKALAEIRRATLGAAYMAYRESRRHRRRPSSQVHRELGSALLADPAIKIF